jgi:2-dehydropantoate 2-reductase
MRFAILGAGALGTILGAHLIRAGHEVAVIARGSRAKWIAERGLVVRGLNDLNTPCTVITQPSDLQSTDCFIIATKAIDTAQSLRPFAHVQVPTVFPMQNGVMKDTLLEQTFGRAATLGGMADFSGELLSSGEVLFTRNAALDIGELTGELTPRVTQLARLIDDAGVRCNAVPDIQTREWSKYAAWVALGPLAALTRMNTWQFLTDDRGAWLAVQLVREACRLADAMNIRLMDLSPLPALALKNSSDEEAIKIVRTIGRKFQIDAPGHRMSVLQDLDRGSRLEIDELLGYGLKLAAERNVPMPVLDVAFRLLSVGRGN